MRLTHSPPPQQPSHTKEEQATSSREQATSSTPSVLPSRPSFLSLSSSRSGSSSFLGLLAKKEKNRKWVELAPTNAPKDGDRTLTKLFGKSVVFFSGQERTSAENPKRLPEPDEGAMALMYKFTGAKTRMISSVASPHLFDYVPSDVADVHHSQRMKSWSTADSVFVVNASLEQLKEETHHFPFRAPRDKSKVNVIISATDSESVAQQVAYLSAKRPDLRVFGHAMEDSAGAIEAFRRVGGILKKEEAVVSCALNKEDSAWLRKHKNVDLPAGAVITAEFNAKGQLNRSSVENIPREELLQAAENHRKIDFSSVHPPKGELKERALRALRFAWREVSSTVTPSRSKSPEMASHILDNFGPVMVHGSSGNIGSTLVKVFSGKVRVFAAKRDLRKSPASHLGNTSYPVQEFTQEQIPRDGIPESTVFLTASAPRPKREDGTIITDRAAMIYANLQKIILPAARTLPENVKLVQVITNPCSEMAYALWLLLPELGREKISGHAGTDLVRQREHVAQPHDPNSYFTFGPHSPDQVNVDLALGKIDASIAVKGNEINKRSGGQPATDPTALSSIFEAWAITNRLPSSYAIPLSAAEARDLTQFINSRKADGDPDLKVHEGLAITIPRTEDGSINWKLLKSAAEQIPEFSRKAREAVAALEKDRGKIIEKLVELVHDNLEKHGHSALADKIDEEWIHSHREKLLTLTDEKWNGMLEDDLLHD